ncbi:MAG TPA: ABC transporter permease, partial [Terriglobia bacterium]|nr:ABC transporter permease [Terriglobia bacterium]
LKRDLSTDLSYKLSFAFQLANILIAIAAFYFLSHMLGRGAFRGYEPFAFILVGMTMNDIMTTSMACYSQAIRGNQPMGTLKMVLATPTSPAAFVLLSSLYPVLRSAFDALLYVGAGLLFGLDLGRVNVLGVVAIYLLSVMAFSSIGILSATFTLVFKRGDPLMWLFGGLSWLLGGVYYPVDVLPRFLRDAAQLLPITHALAAMRAALLGGASLGELGREMAILAAFAVAGLPLSLAGFYWGVRRARISGTIAHF